MLAVRRHDMDMTWAGLASPVSRLACSQDLLTPHLRHVRLSRSLTQAELAERAGLSRATVMALEGGRDAWPTTVRKLARALGVRPQVLTGQTLER
jgi:DNA-binding XRE family transcriptional regulator